MSIIQINVTAPRYFARTISNLFRGKVSRISAVPRVSSSAMSFIVTAGSRKRKRNGTIVTNPSSVAIPELITWVVKNQPVSPRNTKRII